jgi:electron transfer flavoprotein alpha subunit
MSVLVYTDLHDGKASKGSLEALSYASKMNAGEVIAFCHGALNGDGGMGAFGAAKVLHNATENLDAGQIAKLVSDAAAQSGADVVVFSHDNSGKSVAPRVAVRMNAGIVAGAISLPDTSAGYIVRKSVFSGKAMADVSLKTSKKVISIVPNSFGLHRTDGTASVEAFNGDAGSSSVKVRSFKPTSTDGAIPLPEADIVVSAGRGMKGPENWGPIEELASIFGAATACSRPVADIGWRPHHEHVGQTGIAIRPTLYFAIGISGAIQHLAGVNGSKVIVVINKDPEAPFFKAADYGIVGDAFEVLPKLIDAAKSFKSH